MFSVALDAALLSTHLAATAATVGLIWFVQVVHYPLFATVGREEFESHETAHRRRTAGLLVLARPAGLGWGLPFAGVGVVAMIHLSTVRLQVPRHAELSGGYDEFTLRRLVRSDWIRTLGWSIRCVMAVAMMLMAS